MNGEIVKHIEFGHPIRKLPHRAKLILDLLCECIKEKKILDEYILLDWYLEKIVKPRNRTVDGKYLGRDVKGNNVWEQIKEYDLMKRQIKEHGGMLPGYYWIQAKQALKYHIGNLVVNGYLVILPVIKLTPEVEIDSFGE